MTELTWATGATRRLLAAAAAGLATVALAAGCQSGSKLEAGTGYVSGDGSVTTWARGARPGPVALTGAGVDGAPINTASYRGHVVVVNFWQSACPPCRAEAADLVALRQRFKGNGVEFLGINGTDDAATAAAFERTYHVPYPTLLDTSATATATLQGIVAVRAVPTTLVLDPAGRVAARVLGRIDPSTATSLVSDVLAEQGGAAPASGAADASRGPSGAARASSSRIPSPFPSLSPGPDDGSSS